MNKSPNLIRDRVHAALRDDILALRLPPGSALHEMDLARRFAVSKSPVRDALLRLETEGLVAVLPRKGYRVTSISPDDVAEMFEMRVLLERACAAGAARRASAEALATLDRFRVLDMAEGPGPGVVQNRAFHTAVAEMCGNRRMATMARDLIEQFERLSMMSFASLDAQHYALPVEEHCHIIDALQRRDGGTAAALVERHINDGLERVLDVAAGTAAAA